eukprot:3405118-Prymnesium_polylepis.1
MSSAEAGGSLRGFLADGEGRDGGSGGRASARVMAGAAAADEVGDEEGLRRRVHGRTPTTSTGTATA